MKRPIFLLLLIVALAVAGCSTDPPTGTPTDPPPTATAPSSPLETPTPIVSLTPPASPLVTPASARSAGGADDKQLSIPGGITMSTPQPLSILVLLAVLAYVAEALTELLVASWLWKDQDSKAAQRATLLRFSSSGFGVVMALLYRLDLIGLIMAQFGQESPFAAAWAVGAILTGLLMGRGGQWFHDLGTRLGVGPSPAQIVQARRKYV